MATANTIDVLDATGKKSGSVELPAELFDVQTNVPLIHQVVVAQLAAARQGTHKTKTRGEVSGAGRKPFKQKGTGRARQGSIRAPQMTGGGIVHGPQPRDYSQRTPKKMMQRPSSARSPTAHAAAASTRSPPSRPARRRRPRKPSRSSQRSLRRSASSSCSRPVKSSRSALCGTSRPCTCCASTS